MSDKKQPKTTKKSTEKDGNSEHINTSFNREAYISSKISELQTRNLQDTEMVKSFLQSVKELNQFGNMILDELMCQRDEIRNLKEIIKSPHKTRQKKLSKFKVVFHTLKDDFNEPPSTGAV